MDDNEGDATNESSDDPNNLSQIPTDNPFELESDHDLTRSLHDTKLLKKNLSETFDLMRQGGGSLAMRNTAAVTMVTAKDASTNPQPSSEDKPATLGVFLRIRPSPDSTVELLEGAMHGNNGDSESCDSTYMLPTKIRAIPPPTSNAFKMWRGKNSIAAKEYEFSAVFGPESNQSIIYQQTLLPIIPGLKAGHSALVFCYGITNAGKTYTVTGIEKELEKRGHENSPSWGLVPRALKELLNLSGVPNVDHSDGMVKTSLSYFEIYNEQIYDLLAKEPQASGSFGFPTSCPSLVADGHGAVIRGVECHPITTLPDGISLIARALKARKSGTNRINRDSSRSHAVCQFRVVNMATNTTADLWIVDLAGSERSKRTGGSRFTETSMINKSLMTLNRCLTTLRENQDTGKGTGGIIPYRESKLTQLFAHHWMGPSASRTIMIVNINPTANDFDETQHALSYATTATAVRVADGIAGAKQALHGEGGAEYDYDGRRKINVVSKTLQVVQDAVKKLSPMRPYDDRTKRKLKDDSVKLNNWGGGQRPHAKRIKAADRGDKFNVANTFAVESDAQQLHAALVTARAENIKLRSEKEDLLNEFEYLEVEFRAEAAKQMEEQMNEMREYYEKIVNRLKKQIDELMASGEGKGLYNAQLYSGLRRQDWQSQEAIATRSSSVGASNDIDSPQSLSDEDDNDDDEKTVVREDCTNRERIEAVGRPSDQSQTVERNKAVGRPSDQSQTVDSSRTVEVPPRGPLRPIENMLIKFDSSEAPSMVPTKLSSSEQCSSHLLDASADDS